MDKDYKIFLTDSRGSTMDFHSIRDLTMFLMRYNGNIAGRRIWVAMTHVTIKDANDIRDLMRINEEISAALVKAGISE